MNIQQLARYVGIVGTISCIVLFLRSPSFLTPDKIVFFLTFVFMIFGQAWPMLKRMLPFVGLLLVYESFRGIADYLNHNVNFMWMPGVDRLFANGELPTVVLQNWWWHGQVQWYDFAFYLFYMMHFVLPFALALYIWKRREKLYWGYVTAYLVVSFAGFLTFVAFPAAPPWMASEKGLIEPITRISSDVWFALGITDFQTVYSKVSPNPVAAVPSLHAAYATLFAMFVTKIWKTRWRFAAWIYPIMIYVGTVYQGEHYVIDEILGALYAVAAYFAAPYALRFMQKFLKTLSQNYKVLIHKLKITKI